MNESDDDSDDWAKDDLPELTLPLGPTSSKASFTEQHNDHHNTASDGVDEDDEDWEPKLKQTTEDNVVDAKNDNDHNPSNVGEPMIIVDMTTLSQLLSLPEIHCKFDPNSVNDVVAVKALRHQIESNYDTYSKKNMEYISERIIIPCGSSVYRPALIELRKDRPGHYFYPIFPPKK
jgi:hypothetical protein